MSDLFDNLQGFIQTNIDLAKLEVQEKIETTAKNSLKYILIGIIGIFSILFILISFALFLGQLVGSIILGFLFVSIILAIISLMVYFTTIAKPNS